MRPALALCSVLSASALLCPGAAAGQSAPPAWPDLAKLGARSGGGEKDAAVLIAVEHYAHVGKVAGAKRNLADWKHWLVDIRGVPDARVFELLDQQVSPGTIRKKAKLAAELAQAGGTIWFLFIGHGVPSKDGADAMLVTYDARQSDEVYKDAIGRKELLAILAAGGQARTVFVADSCFSGGRDHGGKDIVRGAQPLVALKPSEVRQDQLIFSAGAGDQFAGPLPGEARPAYTYLLLGGLMGWADGVVDGKTDKKVTVFEANQFARTALMMQDERDQEPEFAPAHQRDAVLASATLGAAPPLKALMGLRLAEAAPLPAPAPAPARAEAPAPAALVCPAGATLREGRCVVDQVTCPSGTRAEGGKCVAEVACPSGSTWAKDRCVPGRRAAAVQLPAEPAPDQASAGALRRADEARGKGDDNMARRLYEMACSADSPRGCAELAVQLLGGRGGPKDAERAHALAMRHADAVERECIKRDPAACTTAGKLSFHGVGQTRNFESAAKFSKLACDRGSGEACNERGWQSMLGLGIDKAPTAAVELFRKSCDAGWIFGCANLGEMYLRGEGVAMDQPRGAELLLQACSGGAMLACLESGRLYQVGTEAVTRDLKQAVGLFRRGCEGGEWLSCQMLGVLYDNGTGVVKDHARAAELYGRACDAGWPTACSNLGTLYDNGFGVAKDQARASELYRKACDREHPSGCYHLGRAFEYGNGVAEDEARAVELYGKACSAGDAKGCANLGRLYANGTGVTKDQVRAAECYRKACDGGDMAGCYSLGAHYANGNGVNKDPAVGRELYRKACDGGYAPACDRK